jgi:hypothetical protein
MSYFRVSILGTLPTGEVWSVNPVFDPTFEVGESINQAELDAACLLIANRSVPSALQTAMSPGASRTGARVEVRDDADDSLIAISVQGSTTPTAGTGTLKLPLQAAIVTSIRTDTPGGSGRGRIYWPALGVTLGTTGRLTTPTAGLFLTDMKSYLLGIRTDLNAAFATIGFDLAVRSKATLSTPHAVRLQVGDVVDTQRRRRDAQPESYTQVAFP